MKLFCNACGKPNSSLLKGYMGMVCANCHQTNMEPAMLTSGAQTMGGHGAGVMFYCEPKQSVLLLKRSNLGDGEGTWCPPGGGVENDETIQEAAQRECREEIGFDPREFTSVLHHMHRVYNPETHYTFHNHYAIVPYEFEPKLNEEHTDAKWFTTFSENLHPGFKKAVTSFYGA